MSGSTLHPKLLDERSWWWRLRNTPLTDVLHGELSARLSVAYLIDEANLPGPLPRTVLQLIKLTKLWHREKLEVARELIGHFQDGLEAGATPQQLVHDFGDLARAAVLIRRAKKRNRPLWWKTGRRTVQFVLLLPVIVLVLYAAVAIRFFMGSPTITHDYLADLKKTAISVPQNERAWPVYREALLGLPQFETIVPGEDQSHAAEVKPGDADWLAYEKFVIDHAEQIALIREAAAMPGLGFVPSLTISDEDRMLWPSVKAQEKQGLPIFNVLLPYLAEMRRMSYVLVIDSRRAAKDGDSKTVVDDLAAITGLVRHARENPVMVGDLVGLAIFQMLLDRVGELLAANPDLFSDAQLQALAHRIASLSDDDLRIRIENERIGFADFVQHAYTDDGHGNGRMTPEGIKLMDLMTSFANENNRLLEGGAKAALTPAVNLLMVDRRDLMNRYDQMMAEVRVDDGRPLWQRQGTAVERLLGQWMGSSMDRMRFLPLVLLAPAVEHATLQGHYVSASRDGILTAIALEMYRRRHGDWPQSLNELVPSFLPVVPLDPYDGQPLRYAVKNRKQVLYSIGVDGDDDGGTAALDGQTYLPDPTAARRWKPASLVAGYKASQTSPVPDGDWILWAAPN